MQDAYTQMEMELEISEVVPDGPCKGFITWAQGNSVTEFDGDVRGNQISFEEMRVVSDDSDQLPPTGGNSMMPLIAGFGLLVIGSFVRILRRA